MNGRRWTRWLLSLLLMALVASSVAAQTPESLSAQSEASGTTEQQPQEQGKEEAAKTATAVASHSVKVDIQGIDGDLLKNVEAYLTLYQKRKDPKLSKLWIKRLHKQAVKEIQQALQPFGYYNVKQASLRSRERFWDIRVPKIDSIFDNSLVPRTSWSPGVPPQHRKLVAATHRPPI